VQFVAAVIRALKTPPPSVAAEFPEIVQKESVRSKLCRIPPPGPAVAELPEIVEFDMTTFPKLLIPPPMVALFPEMVELEIVRISDV